MKNDEKIKEIEKQIKELEEEIIRLKREDSYDFIVNPNTPYILEYPVPYTIIIYPYYYPPVYMEELQTDGSLKRTYWPYPETTA